MRKVLTVLLVILLSCLWAGAQQYRLFTLDDGLCGTRINQVFQDSRGMIWVATETGLSRYDGARIVSFKADASPGSIAHNIVRYVFEDDSDHLFVCTHRGIQTFDRESERFSPLATDASGAVFDGNINNMLKRPDGEVWASGNILCRVTVVDGAPVVEKLRLPVPTEMTERLYGDSRGAVWVTVFGDGLYRLSAEGDVSHFLPGEGVVNVTDVCEVFDANVYVSTTDGRVYRYDRRQDILTDLEIPNEKNTPTLRILPLSDDRILLATDGAGIKVYEPYSGLLEEFQVKNSLLESSKLKVHSLIQDNSGNLWMGLYQKGVAMLPRSHRGFDFMGYRSVESDIIGSCCVTALCRDASGQLWVGTDNDGIYGVSGHSKDVIHIPANPHTDLAPNTVIGLFEDSSGRIWFGSYNGGFGYIDSKHQHCVYLDRMKSVYSFAESFDGRVWIGSMGFGLMYFDRYTGRVVYDEQLNRGLNQWISSLEVASDGTLYVGSYEGLASIDVIQMTVKSSTLPRLLVHDILEDRLGRICAGTTQGLYILDPITGEQEQISLKEGLPDQFVYAVEEDDSGRIWLSTGTGLSAIDPFSHGVTNFFSQDGILAGEFSQGASCADSGGCFWFGGSSGVVSFRASDISKPSRAWPVRLTGFYLYNTAVTKGSMSGHRQIIDTSVYDAREFRLSRKDNSFTLEFAPINFDAPVGLSYMYSVDGGSWTELPRGVNTLTATGVKSGRHLFSVKSVTNGVESEEYVITINIAPAWWFTWWSILLYFLLGVVVAVTAYHQVNQSLLYRQTREINEAKTQFFTNISHEIRTPMSLIMGPLQKLINSDANPERQKSYLLISRNAKRILQLVNQMMDLRKIESGQLKLSFCPAKVVRLIDSICELFVPQAEQKHISFEFLHETVSDDLVLWVDAENFDKIIMNILSNAFKFTPDGGRVTVRLEEAGGNAVISISDTGAGIPENELEKVFDRFYQSSSSYGKSMGTGVGLNLTRFLVELHHGTIVATSNTPDPGTTFTVSLPLGSVHLEDSEKSDSLVDFPPVEAPVVVSAPASPVPSGAKTRRRLLLVEDDDEIKQYLADELSSDFYILKASNGREALDLVFKKSPDIIISDVLMPEMDGYELCRRIKGNINLNHIPVILLTAMSQDEDKIKGLEGGADAYFTKPFNIEVLRSTVINQISLREKLKVTFTDSQVKTDELHPVEIKTPDEKLMARVMAVVNSQLGNPDLTVEDMAAEVGLSRVHLHRKLKELTNQTPHEFLRNARLMKAAEMFSEKKHSISEVAYAVGFSNPANFATAFKALFGVTPTEYMQRK